MSRYAHAYFFGDRQPGTDPMNLPGGALSAIPILAHRGYAARFPENTREAIAAAVDAGARHVEFDIQLSADRVPFLLHDEDFVRTGNLAQRIFDLDATQVAAIDVSESARLANAYTGVRPPRLSELVDDLDAWPSVTAFVELKRQSIQHFGHSAVLDAVLPMLQPVLERCVIISFDLEVVLEARKRVGCRIGWALSAWNSTAQQQATGLAPEFLFCNVKRLPPVTEVLWKGPWTWVVYEITEPAQARELVGRGVGMIETMACAELAAGLAEGGGS
jgi:glycerophosphoryl diester phosphodiesterase